ncbi:MAG: 50S ribosomal protein L21 [Candidatus Kapaibacteriota bacterium]
MLAVVEIAGGQFEVEKAKKLNVPLLDGNEGDVVEFSNILLTKDGETITVGEPYVKGTVTAKILSSFKDKKVLVFHKKRRKGYQKLNGHRQQYTNIEILDIKIN